MNVSWLRSFLQIYWLRPENALWRAINCAAMAGVAFPEPSLDLSCGDGLFSFLRAGGQLEGSFDIFESAGHLDRFFANVDIYDSPAADYAPPIIRQPDVRMTIGTDWKQNLLDKAAALNFYRDLLRHDNNRPLPFSDRSFATVFSNSVYWMPDADGTLREIARVLRDDGRAVLVLKTDAILDYTLEAFEADLGRTWLAMIDRGRRASYPRLFDDAGWRSKLADAGLEVVSATPQITWVHAHMWDVGLRPLSPLLIEMTQAIPAERRREIKDRWVTTWEALLQPFCRADCVLGQPDRPPAEIIYVARRAA